jgi:hypothetical protein
MLDNFLVKQGAKSCKLSVDVHDHVDEIQSLNHVYF